MSEQINTNKYTIQTAFKECFYKIPQYQREYVWTQKEITLLLEDIIDSYQASSNFEYFIGTTIVSEVDGRKSHYDVIDGQQRLTTLFLSICVLRSLLNDEYDLNDLISDSYSNPETGKKETLIKLELNYDGVENLIKYIAQNKLTPKELRVYVDNIYDKTNSVLKIADAYEIIYQYFKNLYVLSTSEIDMDKLGRLWAYISNKVVFIQIKTDVNSALKIFETINERGVGLNPMDLLKNLIFYQVPKEDFKDINKLWHEITKPLEENQEKPLRFLRYYIMANYNIDSKLYKDGVIREDQIFEWFKNNETLCNYNNYPREFVQNIKKYAGYFINLVKGKYIDGSENLSLQEFQQLCGGSFSLHYILLLSAVKLPQKVFNHLVKQLETLIFYYLITKNSTKELEKTFTKWASKIREISAINDMDNLVLEYNTFIKEHLQKEVQQKEIEYENYFKTYDFYSLQQYRTRYILAKIAQYVDNFIIGENLTPRPLNNYLKLEIEHILPNTQKENIADDFYKNSSEKTRINKEYDDFKIKLGNLTLLEKPINIVAGCNVIKEKSQQYMNSDVYLTQSIIKLKNIGSENSSIDRINKFLCSYELWNDSNIMDRQERLYILSKKVWVIEELK